MKKERRITLEVGAKAFVYIKPGRYLILKRAHPYHGQRIKKWDVPGGRITPGEPVEKALAREIKEETGLTLKKIKKILTVQDILRVNGRHTVRVTFLASAEGKVKLNPKEHSDFRWLSIEEIKRLRHDIYLTPVLKTVT